MNKKILIVDDNETNLKILTLILKKDAYRVLQVTDPKVVRSLVLQEKPDLILLDVNMPDINGFDLAERLKKDPKVEDIPIIFISALSNSSDVAKGFAVGAVDYITKPYNPTILLLRIAAVLKRMEGSQNTASYRDAEVNFSKGTISKGDQEMVLTKNEMIIFQLLLANREKIVSRDEIMTDLWDNDEFVNDNALTVNISRLRGKLADLGYDDAIETRKKQGYRLV